MTILFYLLMIGLSVLGLRAVRAFEGSRPDSAELDLLAEEIERLRDQHQVMARQIASLREDRDFARRLRRP